MVTGADPGFCERGSDYKGGSLKQGSGRHIPPEAIGCCILIAPKITPSARFIAYI